MSSRHVSSNNFTEKLFDIICQAVSNTKEKRVNFIHINLACIYFLIVNCENKFNQIHNKRINFI